MKYYKILKEDENHHGLQYKMGLNVDHIPFNPSGSCESGGMYYAQKDILAFLYIGPWIREVTLCPDSNIYKDPNPNPEKWKTDKFILGERRRINSKVIQELIQEGADVHAQNDYAFALIWASENGHHEIAKLFLEHGADVHAQKDESLRWASEGGHLEVVKLLLENGADVHAQEDEALRWASENGHLEVVKLLLENGANVHAEEDEALRWASEGGHLEVVKLLLENGADGHLKMDI